MLAHTSSVALAVIMGIILVSCAYSISDPLSVIAAGPNSNWTNQSLVEFTYFLSSNESVENCSLYLNGVSNQTCSTGLNGSQHSFFVSVDEGYYLWSIGCVTNSRCNASEPRVLYVDRTPPMISIVEPAINASSTARTVAFGINATDNLNTSVNCSMAIDGQGFPLTWNGSLFVNSVQLLYGNHSWWPVCSDAFGNSAQLDLAWLNVTGELVNVSVSTDQAQYRLLEQVNIIVDAPANASLGVIIRKEGMQQAFDSFTTAMSSPRTIFFRNFEFAGNYTVDINLSYYGLARERSVRFEVIGGQLGASIEYSPATVRMGQVVHFHSHVAGNISPVTYAWDFTGDGVPEVRTANADYTYSSNGAKRVNLSVADISQSFSTVIDLTARREVLLQFTVVDNDSSVALADSGITLNDMDNRSDVNGRLDWIVLEGEYALAVRKDGYYSSYSTLVADAGKSVIVRLRHRKEDIAPPSITIVSPANGETITGSAVTLVFRATDASPFNCSVYYSAYANWYSETVNNISMENNTDTSTVIGLAQMGKNYWRVECADTQGNEGGSSTYVFTAENQVSAPAATPSSTAPATTANQAKDNVETGDELGVRSKNIVDQIDSTLSGLVAYSTDQQDVADAIMLRKNLDDQKTNLVKVRRDIYNLQFLGLSASDLSAEREKYRAQVDSIENGTIKDIRVIAKTQFAKYPGESDIEKYARDYLAAKNINLSKKDSAQFVQKVKDGQVVLTVSTKVWSVELEYLSLSTREATVVERSVYINGDSKGFSLVEFIPKNLAESVNAIDFMEPHTTIQMDPIIKTALDENNRTVYIIYRRINLADADQSMLLLIPDDISVGTQGAQITGLAVFRIVQEPMGILVIGLIISIIVVGSAVARRGAELPVIGAGVQAVRTRLTTRKDIKEIWELVERAHIQLRSKKLAEARISYGDLNIIYRKLVPSARKDVFAALRNLHTQIDLLSLNDLVDEGMAQMRSRNHVGAKETYQKVQQVYACFDSDGKRLAYPRVAALMAALKDTAGAA